VPEWKSDIRKRLASLKLELARENEIVEELAGHLEDRYRELLAAGASHEEADLAARRELSDGQLLVRELNRIERQTSSEPLVLGSKEDEHARKSLAGSALWASIDS